jgi:predicted MFS family arabinose efflux permease
MSDRMRFSLVFFGLILSAAIVMATSSTHLFQKPSTEPELLIIKMAVSKEWDKIFEIMYLHHIVTGVLILSFTYIYPSIRDFQQGFDVFSVEYLPLALFGVYGFIVNFAASVAIKKWMKWYIEKG